MPRGIIKIPLHQQINANHFAVGVSFFYPCWQSIISYKWTQILTFS